MTTINSVCADLNLDPDEVMQALKGLLHDVKSSSDMKPSSYLQQCLNATQCDEFAYCRKAGHLKLSAVKIMDGITPSILLHLHSEKGEWDRTHIFNLVVIFGMLMPRTSKRGNGHLFIHENRTDAFAVLADVDAVELN